MGNEALDINPPNATYHLSTHGSDWLWTAFSLFGVSLLAVVLWTFSVRYDPTHSYPDASELLRRGPVELVCSTKSLLSC